MSQVSLDRKFELAIESLTHCRPRDAIGILSELFDSDPNFRIDEGWDKNPRFYRARAYCEIEDYQNAIEDFTALIENMRVPACYPYSRRGICRLEIGEIELALIDLDQAISLSPGVWEYYNQRARIYDSLRDRDRAHQDRLEAVRLRELERELD